MVGFLVIFNQYSLSHSKDANFVRTSITGENVRYLTLISTDNKNTERNNVIANGKKAQAVSSRGVVVTGQSQEAIITGDVTGNIIFHKYTHAPEPIASHILIHTFQSLIADRTKAFIGRHFIFETISQFIIDPAFSSGYIVIHGEPGIGKSAIVAELVNQYGYVHHFNIAPQNISSPKDFLSNVCAQLIVRYELDYSSLPERATKNSGFLAELLEKAVAFEGNLPVVVVVDALDESSNEGNMVDANRLFLPHTLPEGVFVIVTTRPKFDVQLDVSSRRDIYIHESDPRNLLDVKNFIEKFIKENFIKMSEVFGNWSTEEKEFVEILLDKSEGNFMYLVHVLRDIRSGRLTPYNIDTIHNLPKGLTSYYKRHWRLMKAINKEHFAEYYQPIVCLLAAIKEPIDIHKLVELTQFDTSTIILVLQEWQEFLNIDVRESQEPLYRIYHNSFQKFLEDEVGLKYYHGVVAKTALSKLPYDWIDEAPYDPF